MKELYVVYVRPQMEVIPVVWDAASPSAKRQLEAVERSALIAVTGAYKKARLDDMQVYVNLVPGQLRQEQFTMGYLAHVRRLPPTSLLASSLEDWENSVTLMGGSATPTKAALLVVLLSSVDIVWVEVRARRGPTCLVGCCYSPPKCVDHIADIERSINAAAAVNRFWLVAGDFNA